MSVTTTDNPVSTTLHRAAAAADSAESHHHHHHLRDYEIHLTAASEPAHDPITNPHPIPAHASADGPADWPSDTYRGMPPYRPINTELDHSIRPWGGNPVGDAFVFTMFTGVWTVAMTNWLWRQTGGRINDRIFRYKIGGEF